MEIRRDDIEDDAVIGLLREHLADMYANSPPESVHALDVDRLRHPSITFWVAREDGPFADYRLDPNSRFMTREI